MEAGASSKWCFPSVRPSLLIRIECLGKSEIFTPRVGQLVGACSFWG